MGKRNRSRYLVLTLEKNELEVGRNQTVLVLTCVLTGQHILVSQTELEHLLSVPADEWVEIKREAHERFEKRK